MNTVTTGDVRIFHGEPNQGNPYRGMGLILEERREALRKFKAGEDIGDLTFWATPRHDAAFRLTSQEQIVS